MISADSDYARIVALLTKQQLAPYVSYYAKENIEGVKHDDDGRVVVRTSDGKIVSGRSSGIEAGDYHSHANPVSHPAFDPACYRATKESQATFEGQTVIKLDLVPTCSNHNDGDVEHPFTTLFADAQTLRPLDVSGKVVPTGDNKVVTVALDQRFAEFSGHVLPSRLKVDVTGTSFMFWLQVHVDETYSDYRFTASP
jgi:hypothetical protein